MQPNYFIGQDGFTWFIGVCEDRDDPKALGRIRVRAFGYHSDDLTKLPSQDLPWAQVVLPPTSAPGSTPNITPGQWVFGFFRDPDFLQQPMVLGVLPGVSNTGADSRQGFGDPNNATLDTQNEKYKSEPDFGPYPLRVGQADTTRLAAQTLETHPEIAERDEGATKDVVAGVDAGGNEIKWSEPVTNQTTKAGEDAKGTNPETGQERTPKARRDPEYPYNHVKETESGHIVEFDDTPFAERIYEKHKSGTFYEIDADGNKVTRIVGDKYEIVAGAEYVNVKGNVNLTIDANCNTFIKGDYNVIVNGNKKETIKGTLTQEVTGAVQETYGATQTTNATGNVTITGAKIDLNQERICQRL